MDDCAGPLHPKAVKGLFLINKGHYFEAHEELEAAWKDEKGQVRELYQGILEAAVTYFHITRGNYPGAVKVYERSMRWLKSWPGTCRGVEVEQLRKDLYEAICEVRRLGAGNLDQFDHALLKPVLFINDDWQGR